LDGAKPKMGGARRVSSREEKLKGGRCYVNGFEPPYRVLSTGAWGGEKYPSMWDSKWGADALKLSKGTGWKPGQ